ncbi:MAG: phosphopentomutase [Clostridiales bacterium]|nr:phosphopentomutase [Clostridiales bacterium]
MKKRVFLIVLDSLGIGEMPDASRFGDEGSNTLKSISKSKFFKADNLSKAGLFNIDGVDCGVKTPRPVCDFCRLKERSAGKDTVTGHWEMTGVVSTQPMPTFPDGFDKEVLNEISAATGRGILCNKPYSGTQVIIDYGRQHMSTGDLIVYTSADSVLQIAAHEKVVPIEELYEICKKVRKIMSGKNAVGRVIARPFVGEYPDFVRTSNRHDYALEPPQDTLLDDLKNNGYDTIGVGKIGDIFNMKGISESIRTTGNTDGLKKTADLADRDFNGLCFVNLVDFDALYGHRNDVDGYAKAVAEFDHWLGKFIPRLTEEDTLLITADHGCDPATPSTDHSREYVPLLIYNKGTTTGADLGTKDGFFFIADTVRKIFGLD